MWLEEHSLIGFCWLSPGAGICAEAAARTGCISEEDYSAAEDRTSHYRARLSQQQTAAHERYPASGSFLKARQLSCVAIKQQPVLKLRNQRLALVTYLALQ